MSGRDINLRKVHESLQFRIDRLNDMPDLEPEVRVYHLSYVIGMYDLAIHFAGDDPSLAMEMQVHQDTCRAALPETDWELTGGQ